MRIARCSLVLLCALAFPASAYQPELLSEKEMIGTLKVSEKRIALLTVGDNVVIDIDPASVMIGDRMNIFDVVTSQQNEKKDDRLVAPVGRLVITDIRGTRVIGKLEFARREIFLGSYINYALPMSVQKSRYSRFLRKIVNDRLIDPLTDAGRIDVAVLDVTDEYGNVHRLGQAIKSELNDAVCKRPQFHCIDQQTLKTFFRENAVNSPRSIGRFIRAKMAAELKLDQLISATAVQDGEQVKIILTTYDVKNEYKTPEIEITALRSEYTVTGGPAEDVIVRNPDAGHGFLKITASDSGFTDGRRVDYLFYENLDNYIFSKNIDSLGEDLAEEIELGQVTVHIDKKTLTQTDNDVVYNDIIPAEIHTAKISVTPLLKGEKGLVIGTPIEKTVQIEVPFDTSIHTEITLKVWGRQAIMLVDSNPMMDEPHSPHAEMR